MTSVFEQHKTYPRRLTCVSAGSQSLEDRRWYYDVEIQDQLGCGYTIRRSYRDFLALYESLARIPRESLSESLPRFPPKSRWWCLGRRGSKVERHIREREFNTLLCWVERQAFVRGTQSYVAFCGEPPLSKTRHRYISLRDYRSPSFEESLSQTREKKLLVPPPKDDDELDLPVVVSRPSHTFVYSIQCV